MHASPFATHSMMETKIERSKYFAIMYWYSLFYDFASRKIEIVFQFIMLEIIADFLSPWRFLCVHVG